MLNPGGLESGNQRAWQPVRRRSAKPARMIFMAVLFWVLLEAVLVWVAADDGRGKNLRNILHRLFGQLLQSIEVPEIALLLAEAHFAQHPEHAVLALVVAGDGEHERVGAELREQVVEVLGGDVG